MSKTPYSPFSTGSAQEDKKTSQHDRKVVDWDVKNQHKEKHPEYDAVIGSTKNIILV